MNYPEIDEYGELVSIRGGSNYGMMLQSVAAGNSLLIVEPPSEPSWWDGTALAWVVKPARPSSNHEWDRLAKAWRDPRSTQQIEDQRMARLRARRDAALAESDVLLLRSLDALATAPLRQYRQALRDLPSVAANGGPEVMPAAPAIE